MVGNGVTRPKISISVVTKSIVGLAVHANPSPTPPALAPTPTIAPDQQGRDGKTRRAWEGAGWGGIRSSKDCLLHLVPSA